MGHAPRPTPDNGTGAQAYAERVWQKKRYEIFCTIISLTPFVIIPVTCRRVILRLMNYLQAKGVFSPGSQPAMRSASTRYLPRSVKLAYLSSPMFFSPAVCLQIAYLLSKVS